MRVPWYCLYDMMSKSFAKDLLKFEPCIILLWTPHLVCSLPLLPKKERKV